MEKTQEAGDVLMSSLSLLGVQIAVASREYGCEIRQDMFTEANQKGLNTLLHLLLERVLGKDVLRKASMSGLVQVFKTRLRTSDVIFRQRST